MASRKRDVVLMATVTSFESLRHPMKSELRQFAELFTPLFQASSEEARRQAVSALSQCEYVPPAVALFVASQPISIAAPFLASSPCLTDDLLIMIARSQGEAHARAIVRREALSPGVIDALVGLRHVKQRPDATTRPADRPKAQSANLSSAAAAQVQAPAPAPRPDVAAPSLSEREELLRQQIKQLSGHLNRPSHDRLGLRSLTAMQEALLVRFARTRESSHFASTLSDVLTSSRWLAERIMLDISGRQLGATLTGLGMNGLDAAYVLTRLYPHLAKSESGTEAGTLSRADMLLASLDPVECEDRIEAWLRADSYTYGHGEESQAGHRPAAANASPATTSAGRPRPRERAGLRARGR
nr:DUF2336 domain-containing protein [Rhizobium sp. CG5]